MNIFWYVYIVAVSSFSLISPPEKYFSGLNSFFGEIIKYCQAFNLAEKILGLGLSVCLHLC